MSQMLKNAQPNECTKMYMMFMKSQHHSCE